MVKFVWYESDEDLGLVRRTQGPSMRADCEELDCRWVVRCVNFDEERAEEKCWNIALGHAHMSGHRVSVYRSQEWTLERRYEPEAPPDL